MVNIFGILVILFMALVAYLTWIATKYEIKKLNLLLDEYYNNYDKFADLELSRLTKKIEKQQMNVSAGKFAIIAFSGMFIWVVISYFK